MKKDTASFGRIARAAAKRRRAIVGNSWKARALRAERRLRRCYARLKGRAA